VALRTGEGAARVRTKTVEEMQQHREQMRAQAAQADKAAAQRAKDAEATSK
jgi:hypothetical protein